MKKSCQVMLLGMLLSSSILLIPMEQALEELEDHSSSPLPSNVPGQPSSPSPTDEPAPPAASPILPPARISPTLPPPSVSPILPPPSALPVPPPSGMLPSPAKSITPPIQELPPAAPLNSTPARPPVSEMPYKPYSPAKQSLPVASHQVLHPAVTAEPKEAVAKPKATLQIVDVESYGLDTINIDSGGNWLEKRIWFKKAEALFDDIRKSVEQAADIRIEFVDAVNAVGKKIDNFYDVVGYDKGQLEELLKQAAHKVAEASEKREGDLSSNERNLHLLIQTEQKQIMQIGDDIKKIEDFDIQIDKTMSQAFKTIDACRALEGKAWEDFKSIGSELDDKKARILYYEMDNAQKNIEQHIDYLKETLLPYLQNKLAGSADSIITTILNAVKGLEAKGIHLKTLLNADEQKDLKVEQEREVAQEKNVEASWEKEELAKDDQDLEKHEQSVKKSSKKKQEDQDVAWYMKFFSSMSNKMQSLGCYLLSTVRAISCKVLEEAPGIFESISQAAQTAWGYVVIYYSIFVCYCKCMICIAKSWICELFGK